ncbi:MAG: CehA/McbA family metallohydrolase [Planctomycetaceae bacterium]
MYVWTSLVSLALYLSIQTVALAQQMPMVTVENQPFVAATQRLVLAMDAAGSPLSKADAAAVQSAAKSPDARKSNEAIQRVLDKLCVAVVHINAESRVKVDEGPATKQLVQQGWRSFLVKVHNEAGITPKLRVSSPNAKPIFMQGRGAREQPMTDQKLVTEAEVPNRFLDISMYERQPLKPRLSGLACEYRIIHLYSRDKGKREAELAFDVGQGTQDLGFRNATSILFDCKPAIALKLGVKDFDGEPTMAAFIVRDERGRVYPNPARRLAPDFFFHNQVYRQDGETLLLPSGTYTFNISRGPEYLPESRKVTVSDSPDQAVEFRLKRWIHAARRQWFSGDHHVHAAGCAHYDSPTEGVGPDDMMRHILGEDLNVGCVLSWGPCWYSQKKFFEGAVSKLSRPDYLMRYDVEVSGFPSSHAGHLCLLRLQEDDFPGTTKIEEWPSWTLPVLKWGKEQGGVVGYSHSGWGLALPDVMPDGSRKFVGNTWGGAPAGWQGKAASQLPDYAMPPFDGIGANEYIVSVAQGLCDFISAVDTPAIWELNIWYHTLNCGFRTRISGETDFPCIYGDKVGLGRIYVKLDEDEELNFDNWVDGLKDGRSYCGDGLSHIMDFQVNNVAVGEEGDKGKISQLNLAKPAKVRVSFDAAALLEEQQTDLTRSIRSRRLDSKPYWHLERCRLGDTRNVPVEVIVNGKVVATRELKADGQLNRMEFDLSIGQSSWVAVRILPSVHTNPVFVHVNNQPIRASRKSAEWCRRAVDVCWNAKQGRIRQTERAEARKAYDAARKTYDELIESSSPD